MPPIPDESPFYAWADESMRIDQAAAPLYLMGAVIAETAVCHRPREQLRELHRAALSNHRNRFARTSSPADRRRVKDMQHKLHWHAMLDEEKGQAMHLVASFAMLHVIVVGAPMNPGNQEGARISCLERLCWELDQAGVGGLILENRTPTLNEKDRRTRAIMRQKKLIGRGFRLDPVKPSEEPMLWIPDQVLGALGAAEIGNPRWLQLLDGGLIERHHIDL